MMDIIDTIKKLPDNDRVYIDGESIMGVEQVCTTADLKALVAEVERSRLEVVAANKGAKINAIVNNGLVAEVDRLRSALTRLRDCDWVITLPDRMDAVREIAREALAGTEAANGEGVEYNRK